MFINFYCKRIVVIIPVIVLLFAACRQQDKKLAASVKETSVLDNLMAGNARFAHWKPVHPDESRERMEDIAKGQHPMAVVISCSDSRVPPELVFDQGLGDLFVVRTAGNLMGGLELGSVEYAVEHLHVPLIIVLGHQQCGAIKAFVEGGEAPGHIKDIIDSIKAEQEISAVLPGDKQRLEHCIEANLRHCVRQLLSQSAIIKEKAEKKELKIAAGIYDLEKGVVTMVSE